VFGFYNLMGFREHGIGYLKQLTGGLTPTGHPFIINALLFLIVIFMIFVETVGHLVRPLALTIRITGNINADHIVLDVFSGMIPLLIPIAFLIFGLLISVVQAFVFSLLTAVYVRLA